jgi:hypothetical protein
MATFVNVDVRPLDQEITRLEKELVRARKAVADLIQEESVLGSVEPQENALTKKYPGLEG